MWSARTAVLSSTGIFTRPNETDPFQMAAIFFSVIRCEDEKAIRVPPVLPAVAGDGDKKAPEFFRGFLRCVQSVGLSGLCYIGGLRTFLSLDYFELNFVTLCERLETRA